ncbi:nuclear transport factor 2 family protein [Candidatus Nitrosotenuis uzonensis]|uniref:SnoaL-like domain-containing protein n=1 Tax=Candidatus Nitrosotenuis uzonensis TaxID=1407055 RepID=V6ARD8_9ARCH|nr:nuclear transport factor 2 family protein [Candidatus Nitrosotenuis uzonensis]CDI05301.1 conserved hypothetical protein [Candidatus Nitrosotenuis uzonensis]
MSPNAETIRNFYDAFKAQDKESCQNMCAKDIEWSTMNGMPNGGTFVGKGAVFDKYFPEMLSNFEEFHAIPEEFLDAGENIVVTGRYEGIPKSSSTRFVAKFVHIYTVHNSKITRFRQYTDTKSIQDSLASANTQKNITKL